MSRFLVISEAIFVLILLFTSCYLLADSKTSCVPCTVQHIPDTNHTFASSDPRRPSTYNIISEIINIIIYEFTASLPSQVHAVSVSLGASDLR